MVDIIDNYKSFLQMELCELKRLLKKYPHSDDGNYIYICHQGRYSKWYKSNGKECKYIPKSERDIARKMATNKYIERRICEIDDEIEILDKYVVNVNRQKSKSMLSDCAYAELLDPQIGQGDITSNWNCKKTESGEIQSLIDEWLAEPYTANPYHPEQLTHKSISGRYRRSKSEALIDTMLTYEGIPFKYECPLEINGRNKYPDFTLRHPRTGKIYYWEHFGWADVPQYAEENTRKMFEYAQNGIVVGANLIVTFETEAHPLDPDTIQKILDLYFK